MSIDDGALGHAVFPSEPGSASIARKFVTSWACDGGIDLSCDDLSLIVSELVTNAIEHGAGPVDVLVQRSGASVELAVTTALTPGQPEQLDPSPTRPSGRGLQIVDAVASDWGHRDDGQRRTVWARLKA